MNISITFTNTLLFLYALLAQDLSPSLTTPQPLQIPKQVQPRNKNPRPIIPTMEVSVLSNNSKNYVPCPPNSREAVPFDTEIFKGSAILICRTTPEDPHYKGFFSGKRFFELQVQGAFKRLPIGEIVVGGESTNKMDLGIIMRSLCKAVCKFAASIITDLHFSFGDQQTQEDYELPHMSAPLFSTMDKVVVTAKGDVPPVMGVPFVEDPEYRKKRMKFKCTEDARIDLTNTYSFSVASSNLDFCKWTTVNIPMVRPMDLRTIWGDSDLRLVAYEIPRDVVSKYPNKHPQKHVNYVLNIKLCGLDPDKAVEIALDGNDEDYDEDDKDGVMSPDETLSPYLPVPQHQSSSASSSVYLEAHIHHENNNKQGVSSTQDAETTNGGGSEYVSSVEGNKNEGVK